MSNYTRFFPYKILRHDDRLKQITKGETPLPIMLHILVADFKIAVSPKIVTHLETLTKKDFKNFKERTIRNSNIYYTKLNNNQQWEKICKERGFIR